MRRLAGFMTVSGPRNVKTCVKTCAKKPTRKRSGQLVAAVSGPYIKVRRGRQNADRAKNRDMSEH